MIVLEDVTKRLGAVAAFDAVAEKGKFAPRAAAALSAACGEPMTRLENQALERIPYARHG